MKTPFAPIFCHRTQAAEFSVQVRLGVDEVARKCKKSGNGGSL